MKTLITVTYRETAFIAYGFCYVKVTAEAEKISEKRCVITKVIDVDGNGSSGYASKDGTMRKQYSIDEVVDRQIGKTKYMKCLTVIKTKPAGIEIKSSKRSGKAKIKTSESAILDEYYESKGKESVKITGEIIHEIMEKTREKLLNARRIINDDLNHLKLEERDIKERDRIICFIDKTIKLSKSNTITRDIFTFVIDVYSDVSAFILFDSNR